MSRFTMWFVAGVMLAGGATAGAETPREAELQSRVDRLEKRLSQVEGAQNDNWLTERRAEEIKGLIHDVIQDSDTRASLLAEGDTAGYAKGKFFVGSADGKFLLIFGGQIQFRYLFNLENLNANDEEDEGFHVRRLKLSFGGHVEMGRQWEYEIVLATARETGAVSVEDVIIGTAITDSIGIKFGKFKLPFLAEELNSSKRLLAVERGQVTEFFTLNRGEQIQVTFKSDMIRGWASINDGANSEFTDIGADNVELSGTARVEFRAMGDFKQADDLGLAWGGEAMGLVIGAAVHYQIGDGNNAATGTKGATYSNSNYFSWTIDANFETNNIGIFAALMGGHIDGDAGQVADREMFGLMVQLSYNINDQWAPFVRFEWLDDDDVANVTDDLWVLTVGVNYFFNKHNAKLTVDLKWEIDGDDPSGNPFGVNEFSSSLGLSSGDTHGGGNLIIRIAFQLLF